MSQELIDRSADLKRLRNEGYELEVKNGYALIHHVPYVNSNREIKYGTLISHLTLAGDKTARPDIHIINFCGEYPCNKDGSIITGIQHESGDKVLADGIISNHSFSNRPPDGYNDYYEKFTRYIEIISAPAFSLDHTVTARTFKVVEAAEESVFNYYDTNTSRAEIGSISQKLANQKIGIIGLGGTGSYILDLVAKTPVAEIDLFDGDDFLQHNAFRAPGAASLEKLQAKLKKTEYFYDIYKHMHKNIIVHSEYIDADNIQNLLPLDFIFICIDKGTVKKEIITELVENGKTFIDVGIGVEVVNDSLIGSLRVTTGDRQNYAHLSKRISFGTDTNELYATNIQIADLNALNATLAVIKWKKLNGFYQDQTKEYNSIYSINDGALINEDHQD